MPPKAKSEQKKHDPKIRRFDVFEAYVVFKSLPRFMRYPPKSGGIRPTPREYGLSLGVTDEMTLCLLDLQTQKNFAEHFEVTEQTLGRWNKVIIARDVFKDLRQWAQPLSRNLLGKLYIQIMEGNALPGHFKLWYEVVAGWHEPKATDVKRRKTQTVKVEVVDLSKS
jgi:hypothetical protein